MNESLWQLGIFLVVRDQNNPDPLKKSLGPLRARIVCLGIKNDIVEKVWLDEDERKILEAFWSYLDGLPEPPVLTGYNIDYFDVPFLRFRTLVHKIQP